MIPFFTFISIIAMVVLGYLFYTLEGMALWVVIIGYPIATAIVPILFWVWGKITNGDSIMAFVSGIIYQMLIGAWLVAGFVVLGIFGSQAAWNFISG